MHCNIAATSLLKSSQLPYLQPSLYFGLIVMSHVLLLVYMQWPALFGRKGVASCRVACSW